MTTVIVHCSAVT